MANAVIKPHELINVFSELTSVRVNTDNMISYLTYRTVRPVIRICCGCCLLCFSSNFNAPNTRIVLLRSTRPRISRAECALYVLKRCCLVREVQVRIPRGMGRISWLLATHRLIELECVARITNDSGLIREMPRNSRSVYELNLCRLSFELINYRTSSSVAYPGNGRYGSMPWAPLEGDPLILLNSA